ncbi:MAG: LPP20 family lipoprotein [Spirochaetaceae bacterium]|nr:LPP20 family lipoprotein [Spirochaetaceae bacterium]
MAVQICALCAGVLFWSCAGTPDARPNQRLAEPQWVSNPSSVYDEGRYVSALGFGGDRAQAEKNALGSLTAIFGQTVRGETRASYRYSEAVNGGILHEEEDREIENDVKTSFAMDTLIGAEIRDYWFDGVDTHYAVAVMEKLKCGMRYNDLVESNERVIRNLTGLPQDRRDTLDAYARYALAATIADANGVFVNVLSVLNPASAAAFRLTLKRGEDYRLIQGEIARNIPIDVVVDQDRDDRVRAAFAGAFSAAGFAAGSGNSPYRMAVSLSLSPVDLPGNSNEFVRYIVSGKLIEVKTGNEVFPFTISGREGHLSLSEAENRAIRVIEQKIRDGFGAEFAAYLESLSAKD